MESIGEKLRTAREEKGYSVDQVARDTNIARRFIEALEGEDFSQFPGDTYVLGFLRNYADYLGLEPEKVITLYKNLKIQEQPIPVEELIHRKRRFPLGAFLVVILVLLLLGGGGYGVYYFLQVREQAPEEGTVKGDESKKTPGVEPAYVIKEEIIEQRFEENDTIRVHLEEGNVDVSVAAIEERVKLTYRENTEEFTLGKEKILDLNGDGQEDIKLSVHDIDTSEKTVVLRFDRNIFEGNGASERGLSEGEEASLATGSTNVESREEEARTIVTSDVEEPFRVSVVFRGYCLLRYEKDDSIREERYFHKGETFRLDVTNRVKLWVSNAASFNARVAGEEVDFGGPGEVRVKLIRWEKDQESGQSKLMLIPVY